MIKVDESSVLDSALEILAQFGARYPVRGRFVALYLGLRKMREEAVVSRMGDSDATAASAIQRYLDVMYTKAHRPEPFTVLTAPFGGSKSPGAPYSAVSGTTTPGRKTPVNTWRNNLNIQKGVGCPAEVVVIESLLESPSRRLACPHITRDSSGEHRCGLRGTRYRGEQHSIWVRMTSGGYQVVNLDHPAVYREYLRPHGTLIPIFPLLAMLYSLAPIGVYPSRSSVGIADFALDFGFDSESLPEFFDCDPASRFNDSFIASIDALSPVLPSLAKETEDESLPVLVADLLLNTGLAAEIAVVQDLQRRGWQVRYCGNQAGRGFDLQAEKEAETLAVEVKSSFAFAQLELTESEWRAAQELGDRYVLAVVDFCRSDQESIWYVRNPAANADADEKLVARYRFRRADVQPLSTDADFL